MHGLLLFDCLIDAVTDWHSKALYKYFWHNTTRYSKYNARLTFNLWRCKMKSCDELKAEMEDVQEVIVIKKQPKAR